MLQSIFFAALIVNIMEKKDGKPAFVTGSYKPFRTRIGPQTDPAVVYAKLPGLFSGHEFDEIDGVGYMVFFFTAELVQALRTLQHYLCFCAAVAGFPMCETEVAKASYVDESIPHFTSLKKDQWDKQTKIFRADCLLIPLITRNNTN
jgi:hypothetical protein